MHIAGDLVAIPANYETVYIILIKVHCSAIEDTKGQLADRLKALRTCWEGCFLEGRAFLCKYIIIQGVEVQWTIARHTPRECMTRTKHIHQMKLMLTS